MKFFIIFHQNDPSIKNVFHPNAHLRLSNNVNISSVLLYFTVHCIIIGSHWAFIFCRKRSLFMSVATTLIAGHCAKMKINKFFFASRFLRELILWYLHARLTHGVDKGEIWCMWLNSLKFVSIPTQYVIRDGLMREIVSIYRLYISLG